MARGFDHARVFSAADLRPRRAIEDAFECRDGVDAELDVGGVAVSLCVGDEAFRSLRTLNSTSLSGRRSQSCSGNEKVRREAERVTRVRAEVSQALVSLST